MCHDEKERKRYAVGDNTDFSSLHKGYYTQNQILDLRKKDRLLTRKDRELQEDLKFLSAKLSEAKKQREKWLNGIIDKWIARRHAKISSSRSHTKPKRA